MSNFEISYREALDLISDADYDSECNRLEALLNLARQRNPRRKITGAAYDARAKLYRPRGGCLI